MDPAAGLPTQGQRMNLNPALPPRAGAMSRAIVTLMQDRESVTPEDLHAQGFTPAEIAVFGAAAVAAAARRCAKRERRRS